MRIIVLVIFELFFSLSYGQNIYDLDSSFVNNDIEINISTKQISNDQLIMTSLINSNKIIIDSLILTDLNRIRFIDFNNDKNLDILVSYIDNNPIYFLYLYDLNNSKFIKIENFKNYPNSQALKQDKLYYSYHRAGCADLNWESDLFRIDNYKIKHIANIKGRGCDSEPQKIEVFKIVTLDKVFLFETVNYKETMDFYEGDKWQFLSDYWNEKYKEFE